MATTNLVYTNPQKQNANKVNNSNRFKINQQALNMVAKNPTLGIGYIIGSMLGENYWGNKRSKRIEQADKYGRGEGAIGADQNGTYGVNNNNAQRPYYEGKSGTDWGAYNNALDSVPRTPAQANKPAVTLENASTTGGMPTVTDYWNRMKNNSGYNPGNTTLFTNGVRDINNVIPGGVAGNAIGADANGVYGVPGANPGVFVDTARGIYPQTQQNANPGVYVDTAQGIYPGFAPQAATPTPIPYTPDQLQQIKDYGGFTPAELRRMGAGELNAPQTESSSGGGGAIGSAISNAINAATQEQTPPPAAQNPAPTPDQMRALKGDAPAPEVYDYVPGYATPQEMSNGGNSIREALNNQGLLGWIGSAISDWQSNVNRRNRR